MPINLWKQIVILILLVSLNGCSTTPAQETVKSLQNPSQPVNSVEKEVQVECLAVSPSDKSPKPVTDVPYAYDKMTEPVVIQLDEEPRLHSPINTIVGADPQAYTLFFREPMNRSSVEKSIQANAVEKDQPSDLTVQPTFTYRWTSDRQLHLLVEIPEKSIPKSKNGMPYYHLNLAGATTQANKPLTEETPQFRALIQKPQDLWMISSDGREQKQVSSLTQPYFFNTNAIHLDPDYLMLTRFTQYCECDADYRYLYALFDLKTKQPIIYPVELTTHYLGSGDFIADTRGFFYAKPEANVKVPDSPTAKPIKVDGFVHGGNFSKNRTHLFLAVGTKTQTKDYDLIVYELATDKQKRYPAVLKGEVPLSELSGAEIGVSFYDNGKTVTTMMRVPNKYEEQRFQYDWQTAQISQWKPPIPLDTWSGYRISADGLYQLYANGGLYKGSQLISGDTQYDQIWLGNTHQLLRSIYPYATTKDFPQAGLYLYDADTKTTKQISTVTNRVIGSSPDGKWIYLEGKPNEK